MVSDSLNISAFNFEVGRGTGTGLWEVMITSVQLSSFAQSCLTLSDPTGADLAFAMKSKDTEGLLDL